MVPIGRSTANLVALLVPLIFAVALVPAIIASQFFSEKRQDRLYRIMDLVMKRAWGMIRSSPPEKSGVNLKRDLES